MGARTLSLGDSVFLYTGTNWFLLSFTENINVSQYVKLSHLTHFLSVR